MMNIREALEETGKATRKDWTVRKYIFQAGAYFEVENINGERESYSAVILVDNNWQPYHEVKEIRPGRAGELWDKEGCKYITFGNGKSDLRIFNQAGGEYELSEFIPDGLIHNKYGWTRLYPPVEMEP
jgi:hypothetical protein